MATLRSLAISILRLDGHTNIAAASHDRCSGRDERCPDQQACSRLQFSRYQDSPHCQHHRKGCQDAGDRS
jgi:hypothetical protein